MVLDECIIGAGKENACDDATDRMPVAPSSGLSRWWFVLIYYQSMKRWKLILYSILICLPAMMVICSGGYLIATNVPRLIRGEPNRIGREYREIAEDFMAHPERASYVGERKVGWRQARRKINGIPWGVEVGFDKEGRQARIWFKSGENEWRTIEIETVRPFPYGLVFYGSGLLVAFVLIGLSAFAVWSFVRFMKERDDFLAATAHDLTTPLVGLRLVIGRNDAEAKNLNERMIRLVQNLKDFLKLGGRPKPKTETFDLLGAYREAYALFAADYRDLFDGDDVAASVDQREGAPETMMVRADETMTMQILWNLLGNDLKYAAPYGRVSVRFLRESKVVKCEFVDEGQGMAPSEMRRAFDRYYRAKTVLKSGKGGFGIGLCTAKEFARAMGGDLTVVANRPKGCIFTLYLPSAI